MRLSGFKVCLRKTFTDLKDEDYLCPSFVMICKGVAPEKRWGERIRNRLTRGEGRLGAAIVSEGGEEGRAAAGE